jgi:hypothetical protein
MAALESLFVALMLLFSPAERERVADERRAIAGECERYTDAETQRNCRIRAGRATAEDLVPYPEQITQIAPPDPGMPDRVDLLRGGRP